MEPSGWAAAIISIVLALFGGAGFWSWWSSRSDRPLKKQEVDNATITVVQSTYGGLLNDVLKRLDAVKADNKEMRKELAQHGSRIDELESIVDDQATTIHRLRRALQHAVDWIEDVHMRWHVYRLRDTPPERPPLNPTEDPIQDERTAD